jgi:hypothetical protein
MWDDAVGMPAMVLKAGLVCTWSGWVACRPVLSRGRVWIIMVHSGGGRARQRDTSSKSPPWFDDGDRHSSVQAAGDGRGTQQRDA